MQAHLAYRWLKRQIIDHAEGSHQPVQNKIISHQGNTGRQRPVMTPAMSGSSNRRKGAVFHRLTNILYKQWYILNLLEIIEWCATLKLVLFSQFKPVNTATLRSNVRFGSKYGHGEGYS